MSSASINILDFSESDSPQNSFMATNISSKSQSLHSLSDPNDKSSSLLMKCGNPSWNNITNELKIKLRHRDTQLCASEDDACRTSSSFTENYYRSSSNSALSCNSVDEGYPCSSSSDDRSFLSNASEGSRILKNDAAKHRIAIKRRAKKPHQPSVKMPPMAEVHPDFESLEERMLVTKNKESLAKLEQEGKFCILFKPNIVKDKKLKDDELLDVSSYSQECSSILIPKILEEMKHKSDKFSLPTSNIQIKSDLPTEKLFTNATPSHLKEKKKPFENVINKKRKVNLLSKIFLFSFKKNKKRNECEKNDPSLMPSTMNESQYANHEISPSPFKIIDNIRQSLRKKKSTSKRCAFSLEQNALDNNKQTPHLHYTKQLSEDKSPLPLLSCDDVPQFNSHFGSDNDLNCPNVQLRLNNSRKNINTKYRNCKSHPDLINQDIHRMAAFFNKQKAHSKESSQDEVECPIYYCDNLYENNDSRPFQHFKNSSTSFDMELPFDNSTSCKKVSHPSTPILHKELSSYSSKRFNSGKVKKLITDFQKLST